MSTPSTARATGRWQGAATTTLAALVVVVAFLGWSPLLDQAGTRLLAPLLLLAVVVLVPGIVLRALRVPLPLVVLAQLVAAAVTLSARWAPSTSAFGLLPTPSTVESVRALMARAAQESQAYAAPVPVEGAAFPALALALGVVALLLADVLSAGLRRPALVAMPALVVLTVPVVVLEEPLPLGATVATAAAYGLVLAAQHSAELLAWTPGALPRRALPAGWAAAAASGVLALVVAVALTPLLPSRTQGVTVSSGGSTTQVDLRNPIADLKRDLVQGDDEPVLQITARGPAPTYVRTTVLDVFDGSTWRPGERSLPVGNSVDGALPLPQGLSPALPAERQRWQLRAATLVSPWLPLPFPASSASAPEGFRYDDATLDAVSVDGSTVAGATWDAVSLTPQWEGQALREARAPSGGTLERWTELPEDFPGVVSQLARDVAGTDVAAYDQAVALQEWFRGGGGFRYSLDVDPGTGEDALLQFLGNGPGSRVGYCEQFSASMAVMARSLGIPARVAVGFLSGSSSPTFDGRGRSWAFSGQDLHAWPELYFAGAGWVRFEPTPSARTGQAPPWSRGTSGAAATPEPSASASPTPSPTPATPEASPGVAAPTPAPGTATDPGVGSRLVGWVQDNLRGLGAAALAGLVLLLAAVPATLRRRRRDARLDAARDGDAEAAWAEVVDHALDLGVPVAADDTVRRTEGLLADAFRPPADPESAEQHAPVLVGAGGPAPVGGPTVAGRPGPTDELQVLSRAVERARYAPGRDVTGGTSGTAGTGSGQQVDLAPAATEVCAALTEAATPARRRRARVWPASIWP